MLAKRKGTHKAVCSRYTVCCTYTPQHKFSNFPKIFYTLIENKSFWSASIVLTSFEARENKNHPSTIVLSLSSSLSLSLASFRTHACLLVGLRASVCLLNIFRKQIILKAAAATALLFFAHLISKHRLDCKSLHDMPRCSVMHFLPPDIFFSLSLAIFIFCSTFDHGHWFHVPLFFFSILLVVPLLSTHCKYWVNFSENYTQRCSHQHSLQFQMHQIESEGILADENTSTIHI